MNGFIHTRRAFSLVEILVAIGIVAVLAVLLSSSVSRGVARAKTAQCLSRLQNMGAGLFLYAADHNGTLPPCALPPQPAVSWYDLLAPYMSEKEYDVHSADRPEWQLCPARKFEYTSLFTVGYGWNYAYFGFEMWAEEWARGFNSRLNEVEKPAQTIIIGDSHDKPLLSANDELQLRLIYPPDAPLDVIAQRHQGKGNYLFLDGHVAAYSPQELRENPALFMKDKP